MLLQPIVIRAIFFYSAPKDNNSKRAAYVSKPVDLASKFY